MENKDVLSTENISFHALSATEWRVLDNRYPRHSIDALLGFVACQGSTYYMTRMNHPLEAERCSSLQKAAQFLVREAARANGATADSHRGALATSAS